LGRSSETSEATATRQFEREDLSAARAKVLRMRGMQRKNSISSMTNPSLQTLITQPGSKTCATSPDGEASQGPSPIDYNLEIEADFPKELVLTMQENAAKKARKNVIGKTLGGRATFKTLLDSNYISRLLSSRSLSSQEDISKSCSKLKREPKPPDV
jgi:hypothetical protein